MTKPARTLHVVHDELDFTDDKERAIDPSTHTWRHHARDEHGHYEQINLRYPANFLPRIMKVVNDENTPFTSAQDVVRNATYHYLLFMDEWLQNPELTELMHLTIQQARVDNRRAEIVHRTKVVDDATASIEEALEVRDWDGVREAIEDGQEVVDTSRIDTTKLRDKIAEAQGKLESHG